MYGTLQENTHQHKCERKVESSTLHEERHHTFVANGYERNKVKRCLCDKVKEKNEETKGYRGVVNIPYVKGLSEQLKRVAKKHGVRATFRPGRKLKELRTQSQCPLGDKRKAVVSRIPCGCDGAVYVGETYRQFETQKKEHERN